MIIIRYLSGMAGRGEFRLIQDAARNYYYATLDLTSTTFMPQDKVFQSTIISQAEVC